MSEALRIKLVSDKDYEESEHDGNTIYVLKDSKEIKLGYDTLNASVHTNPFVYNDLGNYKDFHGVNFMGGIVLQAGRLILCNCCVDNSIQMTGGDLILQNCSISPKTEYAIQANDGVITMLNCTLLNNEGGLGKVMIHQRAQLTIKNTSYDFQNSVVPFTADPQADELAKRVIEVSGMETKMVGLFSRAFSELLNHALNSFQGDLDTIKQQLSRNLPREGGIVTGIMEFQKDPIITNKSYIPNKASAAPATETQLMEVDRKVKPIKEGGTGAARAGDAVRNLFSDNEIKNPVQFPIIHNGGAGTITPDAFIKLLPPISLPKDYPDMKVIQQGFTISLQYCAVWNFAHLSSAIVPKVNDVALVTSEAGAAGIVFRQAEDKCIFLGYLEPNVICRVYGADGKISTRLLG